MFCLWRPDVSEAGLHTTATFRAQHSFPCTDPDTALHKVAQALIIQSIDSARTNHEEYRLDIRAQVVRKRSLTTLPPLLPMLNQKNQSWRARDPILSSIEMAETQSSWKSWSHMI